MCKRLHFVELLHTTILQKTNAIQYNWFKPPRVKAALLASKKQILLLKS